jgi:hypothetical protein
MIKNARILAVLGILIIMAFTPFAVGQGPPGDYMTPAQFAVIVAPMKAQLDDIQETVHDTNDAVYDNGMDIQFLRMELAELRATVGAGVNGTTINNYNYNNVTNVINGCCCAENVTEEVPLGGEHFASGRVEFFDEFIRYQVDTDGSWRRTSGHSYFEMKHQDNGYVAMYGDPHDMNTQGQSLYMANVDSLWAVPRNLTYDARVQFNNLTYINSTFGVFQSAHFHYNLTTTGPNITIINVRESPHDTGVVADLGWHLYSIRGSPDGVVYYIDGVSVYESAAYLPWGTGLFFDVMDTYPFGNYRMNVDFVEVAQDRS